MNRLHSSMRMGVQCLFVLALLVLSMSNTANAQFKFVDIDLNFYAAGAVNTSAIANVSAILAATDADTSGTSQIFGTMSDGDLSTGSFQFQIGDFIDRGIIANIEGPTSVGGGDGEGLFLVAGIQNVTASVVASIRAGDATAVTNSNLVIQSVSATLNSNLFAANIPATAYTAVFPNYVTGIGTDTHGLGVTANSSTAVVVAWYLPSWVVSATATNVASINDMSASLSLDGNTGTVSSNRVGVETVIPGSESGPQLEYSVLQSAGGTVPLALFRATDTISNFIANEALGFADAGPGSTLDTIANHISLSTAVATEYRTLDVLHFRLAYNANENLDGEPDAYFGASSDPIIVDGTGLTTGTSFGSAVDFDATLSVGGARVLPDISTGVTATSSLNDLIRYSMFATGGTEIIDVSGVVRPALIGGTVGQFTSANVSFSVADDIGNATNFSIADANRPRIDTVPPVVTAISGFTEGDIGIAGRKKLTAKGTNADGLITTDGSADDFKVQINVSPEGETVVGTDFHNWFNVEVSSGYVYAPTQTASNNTELWGATESVNLGGKSSNLVSSASAVSIFPDITGSNITGVSTTITAGVYHATASYRNAGLVFQVSDDARNPAFTFATGSRQGNSFIPNAAIADSTYYFNTSLVNLVTRQTTIVQSKSISGVTFALDNTGPTIISATAYFDGLPSNYFVDSSLATSKLVGNLNQLQNNARTYLGLLGTVDSATSVQSAVDKATNFPTALLSNATKFVKSVTGGNGSPLEIVVTYSPIALPSINSDLPDFLVGNSLVAGITESIGIAETDGLPVAGSTGLAEFNSLFQIDLGFSKGTTNAEFAQLNGTGLGLPSGWTVQAATTQVYSSSFAGNAVIGFATIRLNSLDVSSIASDTVNLVSQIRVGMTDTLGNRYYDFYAQTGKANLPSGTSFVLSNPLTFDASAPIIGGASTSAFNEPKLNTLLFGDGVRLDQTTAAYGGFVFYVTDTRDSVNTLGKSVSSVSSSSIISLASISDPAQISNGFVNGASVATPGSALVLQAGHMMIISATFHGGNANLMAASNVAGVTANLGFPFGFADDVSPATFDIDPSVPVVDYGSLFRVMSADFSDFIPGSKDVLPTTYTITAAGSALQQIHQATAQSVVNATWFFLIDSNQGLTTGISATDIRRVTLAAKDLAGSKREIGFPAGRLDNTQPTVSIVSYKLTNPNRATQTVVVQSDTETVSAFSISHATGSANTSYEVVARISNGTFDSTTPARADFSAFGGSSTLAPSSPAIATIAAATTIDVTFTLSATGDNSGTTADTAAAQIEVTAIRSSGTQASVQTTAIQRDSQAPTFDGTVTIGEGDSVTVNGSTLSADSNSDGIVRPGQTIIVQATTDVSAYESNGSVLNNFTAVADFSAFSATDSAFASTSRVSVDAMQKYRYDFSYTIPTDTTAVTAGGTVRVTDMASNTRSSAFASVLVESNPPRIEAVRMLISKSVERASGYYNPNTGLIDYATIIATGPTTTALTSSATFTAGGADDATAALGVGDQIRLVATILPNDPVFTDPNDFTLSADFSQFGIVTPVTTPDTAFTGAFILATWTVTVSEGAANSTQAFVPLSVSDPAGLTASGVTSSPTIAYISAPIDVANLSIVQSYAALPGFTSDGSAAGVTIPTATSATYTVVVNANFDQFAMDGDQFAQNTPGNVLAAELNRLGVADAAAPSAAQMNSAILGLISINNMNFSGTINQPTTPTDLAIHNGAGSVSSVITAGAFSTAFTPAALRGNPATLVSATFGTPGTGGTGYKIPAGRSVASASLLLLVSDTVGNEFSQALQSFTLDGTAPSVSGQSIVLNASSPSGTWLPARYTSSGTLISPTRVTGGALLDYVFTLTESPDNTLTATDVISAQVDQSEFGAGTEIKSSTGLSVINGSLTVGSSVSTFPVSTNPANFLSSPAALLNLSDFAQLNIFGRDSANKSSAFTTGNQFQVDNEGPLPLVKQSSGASTQTTILALSSLSAVNALEATSSILNSTPGINVFPSGWLVWAGTVVVDGTEDVHLSSVSLDFQDAFEQDIARFNPSSIVTGSKVIGPNSATRTIRFVTWAVQALSNASPAAPNRVRVTLVDALMNTTNFTTGFIGLNAEGPGALEVSLNINGVEQSAGSSNLGIGSNGDDRVTPSVFEVGPNATVKVTAIITSVTGVAPGVITADFSDIYPARFSDAFTGLLPSSLSVNDDDQVVAVWEFMALNYANLLQITGAGAFDAANLPLATDQLNLIPSTNVINSASFDVLLSAGGNADPAQNISLGASTGADVLGSATLPTATDSLNAGFYTNFSQNDADALVGFPQIAIQPDSAIAKTIALITVTVDDLNDVFTDASVDSSIGFTLDTKSPTGDWMFDPLKVTRELPATILVTNPASNRIGYPTAPTLTSNTGSVPNRVRGGDVVPFVFELENELISGTGNDDFNTLPGTTLNRFDIDETGGLDMLQVSGNFVEFASGLTDAVADVAGTNGYIISVSPRANDSDLINATYSVQVTKDIGLTASTSKTSRAVTATVLDDANNAPYNTYWNNSVFTRDSSMQPVGVDNRAPLISGNLEVVLESGTASLGDQTFNPGDQISDNARISASSILAITVTVTDSTDNPLDVLVNPNYGVPAMVGQNLPDVSILLQSDDAKLIGPDNISIPFRATLPGPGTGRSTREFSFVINASDTLGNTRSVSSINSFGFDGAPFVQIAESGSVVTTSTILANAGSSLVLSATALDLGGVTSISWLITPATLDGVAIATENGGIVKEITPSVEEVDYLLTITPEIGSQAGTITAFATATDISGFQSSSDVVQITINQPALFTDDAIIASVTEVSGLVSSATVTPGEVGLNAAGTDIRSITISEGQVLGLNLFATDVAGSPVTISATGSALFSSSIESATYDPSNGSFLFAPGFLAVTDASSTLFELELSATDGTTIAPDNTTLQVNVLAQSATPELEITGVTVNDVTQTADSAVTVSVSELQTLVINLAARDTGNEDLTFAVETSTEGVGFTTDVSGTSVLAATVTYTPTLTDADAPNFDSPIDPFFFIFQAANSAITAEVIKPVDIVNVSQAPTIDSVVSVNGAAATAIGNTGSVEVMGGDTVVFTFTIEDPDGDSLTFPTGVVLGDIIGSQDFTFNVTSLSRATATLTASIIEGATPDATATVIVAATDGSVATRNTTHTFTIAVATNVIPPVTAAGEIDELIIAQGFGGTAQQQTRNVDTTGSTPLLGLLNTLRGMPGSFEANVGGGIDRSVYVSVGDVNNDGQEDIVNTFGPITASATFPNMFIVRDGQTREVVGAPFNIFPHDNPATFINLTSGELRTAVGNFTGSATNQIAIAQGFGSQRGTVRIVEFDPTATATNGWKIVAQFNGLSDSPANNPTKTSLTNNANGGVTIAAGDVDGDGFDELIVGQTNSATSDASFQIVDIDGAAGSVNGIIVDADVTHTFQLRAFGNARTGEGGVNVAVADLTGDGAPEIIVTSLGHSAPTLTTNPVSVFHTVVTDGTVTGLVRPAGTAIFNAFTTEQNPSSSVSVGAGEFNGSADGSELIFGSNAILGYDALTTTVTVGSAAPQDKYIVLKAVYNDAGDTITSVINVIDENSSLGRDAFIDFTGEGGVIVDQDPSSGGLNVAGGNTFSN